MRMIATRLRAEIARLGAGVILTALPLFAGCTEEAGQEPGQPSAAKPATHTEEPRPPSPKGGAAGRASRLQQKRSWWNHAHEVLFNDIALSAAQAREIDAIIDDQLDKRAELLERDAEGHVARKLGDRERADAARAALGAIRAQLEEPHEIYDALRALLSEEQRPRFDMNRARLVAESQAPTR